MRKALIETTTSKVSNVIELEDGANWQSPAGHFIRDADNASPGDTWDGTKFAKSLPTSAEIIATKRGEAHARAVTAIKNNASGAPWGKILNDMAVAQGWIEPV